MNAFVHTIPDVASMSGDKIVIQPGQFWHLHSKLTKLTWLYWIIAVVREEHYGYYINGEITGYQWMKTGRIFNQTSSGYVCTRLDVHSDPSGV